MKTVITTLAVIILLPITAIAAPTTAKVRLIDTIAVEAPDITLGEIATIDTDNEALRERLANTVITAAPRVENPRILSALKVRAVLDREGYDNTVKVLGTQCHVSTQRRLVDDDEMISYVQGWINHALKAGTQAEIDFMNLATWYVPAGDDVHIVVESGHNKLGGNMLVTVRAMAGDKVLTSTRARVHVSLYRESPVMIRPLQRGEALTADHFEIRHCNVTQATGMELADAHELIGLEARRNLKVGSLLSVNNFQRPVLVDRGSLNRIIVVNKNIRMSVSSARALQSGKKGDTIRFTNPMNAREPLYAKVLDKGLAIIEIR